QYTNCKKIINIGSCQEYSLKNGKCKEHHDTNSYDFFSLSKNTIREYLTYKCIKLKISLIWLRPFYIYGPYQRKESLIPSTIFKCKTSKRISINNSNVKLDFVHVYDVCNAINKFISYKDDIVETFNVGYGKSILVDKVVNKISKNYDGIKKIYNKNNTLISNINFYSDNSKIKKYINWSPKITIDQGIKKIIYFK
ncbi:NAD-dependent epimerase/dehydratase family protein, partial [Alphaproteobacteria bacterium]|nr:NAD-dependent epimerase/dehydratase family protein [Alphaproteobacteria bacterium]